MLVKELIDKLSELNEDLDVIFYSESEDLAPQNSSFRVVDPVSFSEKEAYLYRTDDGIATVGFGNKPLRSMQYALIELTSDT